MNINFSLFIAIKKLIPIPIIKKDKKYYHQVAPYLNNFPSNPKIKLYNKYSDSNIINIPIPQILSHLDYDNTIQELSIK